MGGKFILTLFVALLLNWSGTVLAEVTDPFPPAARASLVRINGQSVWAHEPDQPLPPASLTKLMTALVVLERSQPREVVTVNATAAQASGNILGLAAGDRVRLIDLLGAMLIGSANDACLALANHIAASEEDFVALMNERAKKLGMQKTHFTNACGTDATRHYSTANDLALLAEAALRNSNITPLLSVRHLKIATIDRSRIFTSENTNELLGTYRGASGVKTGSTETAGPCLIAFAQRGPTRVLLILLNATNRWRDARTIFDQAFLFARTHNTTPSP